MTARSRRAFGVVVWLLALGAGAVGLAGCASMPPAAGAAASTRVLVYNIHAGRDADGADNLTAVAELVRGSRADVVLLQEVDRGTRRSGGVDQVAVLAGLTGYHAAFGRTLDYQGGEYGIALLSRWPIASDSVVRLAVRPAQERAGGSYEPRGVLHARLATPSGTLHVLNTHLDASADDRYRLQEVETVLALAARLRGAGEHVVLGGDLNATPESAVLARLRDGGWTDAWPGCGSGEGHTFPAAAPTRRIDYLVLPASLRCDSAAVLESTASDHRPVLFVVSARGSRSS